MSWQPPKGTRDFLPEEMARRREVFDKFRKVFESYGYGEVCTPAFEEFELLAKKSGPDIKNEIYYFKDKSGRELGLRFDPTVPICRIVATNTSLPKPIKFYYITNMWRYDQPGKGRWREFWQAGLELIGSSKPEADAEILAVTKDLLESVGIKEFYFRINSRKVVEALVKKTGIPESKKFEAFRAVDKLSKIGEAGVKKELEEYGIKEGNRLLSMIKKNEAPKEEVRELEEIIEKAKLFGVKNVKIDLSVVRGIDYYTGFVFETFVDGSEDIGSVCSGGRYDELIKIYGGEDLPATGFGLGIDRVMEVLKEKKDYYPADVFVAAVNDDVRDKVIEISQVLRNEKIRTDFDLAGRDLRKQFDYVNRKKIPFAVVVGPKEIKDRTVVLRDMKSGKEERVNLKDLSSSIKRRI